MHHVPLRLLKRSVLACALSRIGVSLALVLPAISAQAQQVRVYSIPAGSLGDVLTRFGSDSAILLSFSSEATQGLRSPGLQGSYSLPDGFRTLLAGSGLQAVPQPNGGYLLQKIAADSSAVSPESRGVAVMSGVTVVAAAERSAVTGGTGSYTGGPASGATGLLLSQRETPQALTIVTRQQMDDQNSNAVSDVMKNVNGVNVQNYDSDRWSFWARGFAVTNFQYDGVSAIYDGVYDWGTTNSDMAIYDRIEVLKGATGLMSGSGDPSATVNMVRKRPTAAFTGSASVGAGSWDNYRGEIDLSGPLNASGSVRGRVVGAYQDKHSYLDRYKQQKSVAYGIVEADLTPVTLLTAGLTHQDYKPRGSTWTGFPVLFSDGTRTNFPTSWNPATDWSRRDMQNTTLFTSLEHSFANDWKIRFNANQLRSKHDSVLGSASGGNPDPATGAGSYFFMGKYMGDRRQTTLNVDASGPFTAFGRQHEAMFGYSSSTAKQHGPVYESVYPPLEGSYFDWRGQYAEPAFTRLGNDNDSTRQSGLYGAVRLHPADAFSLILGARISNYKQDQDRTFFDRSTADIQSHIEESKVVTPYAGAVYDLDQTYSVFGSYTSIFAPQSNRDINRNFLSPVRGKGIEAGVKAEYLDGKVNASASVFQIRQSNVASYVGSVNGEEAYKAVDGVASRGLEMEVTGEVAKNVKLSAGYTYSHVRDADDKDVFSTMLQTTQPAHLVRVQGSWRLPASLDKITVGGGVNWQSSYYGKLWNPAAEDYARIAQGSYALLNLMVRYDISKTVTASLNVNNLFNKQYLTGLGLFETGFYGEPRNAMFTLRSKF
ncbi:MULTISPECIES: TonB-dependent receptor [unclassified Janthinobacterium]|uniref:TonB-dependent siderophore receptor n=1 Tax=unclassified Janthinobacterium TaxID=2610881 RepID=UPI0016111600|nr:MULTISPECIES: TonB-dependent receptor [unclassified Janthinobacterium]MBB5367965.1 outer membrane receptor for ferric coprogen and ferric-rhodotorulic acid [Janthinobacterium sp. K2C7]MBB5379557.1 outer membrane receptor for ferric coprogen and ferric-rhodotorulic acid [Janthinobacterium sp. K2Li3]MBB5386347.1 outer membrane receptor for ferric coprogen and ferric-rhodotorulic acid [Janthinobacterium sp. K2E3]